jgi:hypothetical protein
MSNQFWGVPAGSDVGDTNAGMPGAAPNGSAMQGNPNTNQATMVPILQPPLPQNSAAQGLDTQLASGNIPHNLQSTNVAQGVGSQVSPAGGDSLLAMMSRGQVILNQSTYGQGSYVPGNGGAGPIPIPAATVVAQPTGQASGVTQATTPNFSGP